MLQKDVLNARTPVDSDHEGPTQGSLSCSRSALWSCLPLRCAGSGLRLQVRVLLSHRAGHLPRMSVQAAVWWMNPLSRLKQSAQQVPEEELGRHQCLHDPRLRLLTYPVLLTIFHLKKKKNSYCTPWCLVSSIKSIDLLCAIVVCSLHTYVISDF